MKTKTSVTLSPEMLCEIDRAMGERGSRSAFIERVLAKYLRAERRIEQNRHDAAIYAANAAYFEAEAEAVLADQVDPFDASEEDEAIEPG
jgi:metal-responsive CopG/Arc/MetJ family transcriptional regulator